MWPRNLSAGAGKIWQPRSVGGAWPPLCLLSVCLLHHIQNRQSQPAADFDQITLLVLRRVLSKMGPLGHESRVDLAYRMSVVL
jgi:hypothetical protein